MELAETDEKNDSRFLPLPLDQQTEPGVIDVEVAPGVELSVFNEDDVPPVIFPGVFAGLPPILSIERAFRDNSIDYEPTSARRRLYRIRFSTVNDMDSVADAMKTVPGIVNAASVPRAHPPTLPMDPLLGSSDAFSVDPGSQLPCQWYIFRCNADVAWSRHGVTGANVVIADIDFGFSTKHEDLNYEMANAYNAFDGSATVDDISGGNWRFHGTAVAGLATARGDNGLGISGFAPAAALWPIQANSGPGPRLSGDSWANAIDWVRCRPSNRRRKVLLLEVQTGALCNIEERQLVNDAIVTAIADHVVVCVAAGNGKRDVSLSKGGALIPDTGSILVAATFRNNGKNSRLENSNHGSRIAVCAPGETQEDITTYSGGKTKYSPNFGGTSGAAPKVAGTIALMLEANDALTHHQVHNILSNLSSKPSVGSIKPKLIGRFLDAEEAVREALRLRGRRLNLLVHAKDGTLWHSAQDDGPSADWKRVASGAAQYAAVRTRRGPLDVFAIEDDGVLRHRRQNASGGWGRWKRMDVRARSLSAATTPRSNGALLVCDASAPQMHVLEEWGARWRLRSRPLTLADAASVTGSWSARGALEAFVGAADGTVVHIHDEAEISAMVRSGNPDHRMTMATAPDGRLTVFVCGADGALRHKTQMHARSDVWTEWESFDGTWQAFSVRRDRDGRLVLAVIDAAGAVLLSRQHRLNRRWSPWQSLGGHASTLSMVRAADGRLQIFGADPGGTIMQAGELIPGGDWSDWTPIPGPTAQSIVAIASV